MPALTERDITKLVKDFLEHRRWRPLRTQSGRFKNPQGDPFQIGEPGMADYCMVNYLDHMPGLALVLWIEMKKPGARDTCRCEPHHGKTCRMHKQMKWRQREESRGAVVVQVSDFDVFERWYGEKFGWLHRGDKGRGQLELLFTEREAVTA